MELLVVLAIIGILIGLLFPALWSARERARVTRARGEAMQLQQAWLAYWQTYGDLPAFTEMDPAAVEVLGGENDNKIAFMEFDNRHYSEGFKDPWGENLYQLKLSVQKDAVDAKTTWEYQTRVNCVNAARDKY
jgi:type II secretory pathway pseudopilin PulG